MALVIKTTGFDEYLDPSGGAWIKALVLGNHGAGKTRSSAYWPDPIFAAAENGLMAVADLGVPYASIQSENDMNSLVDHVRRDAMQPPERRKYRTMVIDTVDAYQRLLVNERLSKERKETMSGWADWGWLATKTNALIEKLQNLPINVVVLMHIKTDTDESDGSSIQVIKSALKGEAQDTIYRDFDLIGLMENSYVADGQGNRVLKRQIRWHSEPKYPMLRDRSGRLPRFTDVDFTSQDYSRIFDAITAGVDDLPATAEVDEAVFLDEAKVAIEEAQAAIAGAPVPPNVAGGPVANPQVPRPAAAKKAAVKKAAPAAKKAAPAVQPQRQSPEDDVMAADGQVAPATEPEAPAPPPAETQPTEAAPTEADAVAVVQEKLGGEVIEETPAAPEPEAVPEPTPAAEPEKAPTPEGPVCGSQPPGLVGDPVPGCGKVLDRTNAVRLSMAQLRTKTALCDDCFDNWKKDN